MKLRDVLQSGGRRKRLEAARAAEESERAGLTALAAVVSTGGIEGTLDDLRGTGTGFWRKAMTDAGLCIDCGKRPQPARRDGEPGTHHRCNPCARVWLARRARRRALLDGEWSYTGGPFGRVCETCNRTVPEGEWVFRIGPDPDGGPVLCWDCAVDAGYARALASAAPHRPILQSASLTLFTVEPGDAVPFMVIRVPPAMPVVAAAALHFLRHYVNAGVPAGVGADRRVHDLTFTVSAGADLPPADLADYVGAAGVFLTATASRVSVPRGIYKAVRQSVYDAVGGVAARRLHRDTVQ